MSSNECIRWQGNLACLRIDGVMVKSRHTIEGTHVFGPDSDHTTLAVSGLSLLSDECTIQSVCIDGNIEESVLLACGYSIDEGAEWTISCGDEACVSISKGAIQKGRVDGFEINEVFHSQISDAWTAELSAVSQGAFVSEQAYLSGSSARMNFASQKLDDSLIWPPREMIGNNRPEEAMPLRASGIIESWTKLSAGGAPSEFSLRAPILEGISTVFVRLIDGPCGVFLIVDDEDELPSIGGKVGFAIRRLYAQNGMIRYGLKAIIS
jgi:hypothetical protein